MLNITKSKKKKKKKVFFLPSKGVQNMLSDAYEFVIKQFTIKMNEIFKKKKKKKKKKNIVRLPLMEPHRFHKKIQFFSITLFKTNNIKQKTPKSPTQLFP